jgi:beta-lactamase regulating signal transducer with metallopeptidase domain
MERFLMEYLVNSIWQVTLLAAGAWLTVRALRPSPAVQHRIWLGVLPLMLGMPLLTHRQLPTAAAPFTQALPADTLTPTSTITLQSADQVATQPAPLIVEAETPAQSPAETATPPWHPLQEMTLTPLATHWLVGLYLATITFMAMRLLSSAWASRRLIAQAKPAMLSDAASNQLDLCCELFAVARPRLLISPLASSPMLVGAIRPSLLLPQSFTEKLQHSATPPGRDIEAVWLHELAHLRRRDHLTNLICRIAALPISYHPAAHAMQQRIRQTREMVCDEMAAAAMQSPLSYARCLVGLARTMQGMSPQIEAVGMFDNGVLEERIMQLTKTKTLISARTRTLRIAAGAAMMLAVLAAPAVFHVTPTLGQSLSPAPTSTTAPPTPTAPAPSPQLPSQPLPAPAAKASPQPAPPPQAAEAKKKQAEAKAAEAQSKAITAESTAQLEDARKRLDEAAKAYSNLATRSADASAKSATAQTPEAAQQLEDARRQLAEANRAWNEQIAKTVDAAIREKQFTINNTELNKHMAEMQARLNSPEFKDKMAKMNQQMAEAQARFNSPEFKVQMEKLNSPEFKKQMADAQAKFSSPEWKERTEKLAQQIAEAQAKFSSPEWKAQMEKLNSPEFKKRIEENSEITRQMYILNDDLARQMDKVSKQIDEALRLWRANAPTQ